MIGRSPKNETHRGHIPIRTCIVCGAKKPKGDLLRLSLDSERWIVFDVRQRKEGRGAYVCAACLPRLRFNKRVQRAFRDRARGLAGEAFHGMSPS